MSLASLCHYPVSIKLWSMLLTYRWIVTISVLCFFFVVVVVVLSFVVYHASNESLLLMT